MQNKENPMLFNGLGFLFVFAWSEVMGSNVGSFYLLDIGWGGWVGGL